MTTNIGVIKYYYLILWAQVSKSGGKSIQSEYGGTKQVGGSVGEDGQGDMT